jgi:hypothetical protein
MHALDVEWMRLPLADFAFPITDRQIPLIGKAKKNSPAPAYLLYLLSHD